MNILEEFHVYSFLVSQTVIILKQAFKLENSLIGFVEDSLSKKYSSIFKVFLLKFLLKLTLSFFHYFITFSFFATSKKGKCNYQDSIKARR